MKRYTFLPLVIIALSCTMVHAQYLVRSAEKEASIDVSELTSTVNEDPFVNAEVHEFELEAPSGLTISVCHIDRKSDVALIIGQGLSSDKEKMHRFASLFDRYDVFLFDYRWAKIFGEYVIKAIATFSFAQKLFLDEVEEVTSVASHVASKKYTKIVGLALCYSAFVFSYAQDIYQKKYNENLFSHLAFDSCFSSFRSFGESILADPYLVRSHEGGAPHWLKFITDSGPIKGLIMGPIFFFMKNYTVEEALQNITIPILFIHGIKDLWVPMDELKSCGKLSLQVTGMHL